MTDQAVVDIDADRTEDGALTPSKGEVMSRDPSRRRRGPRLIDGDDLALTIIEDAAALAAQLVRDDFGHAAGLCGSPIERIWLAQMLHPQWGMDYSTGEHPLNFTVMQPNYEALRASGWEATPPPAEGVWIFPQYPVGAYRVDFLLWSTPRHDIIPERRLIIECDGHEFHEKTKEQVRRDKERERAIVATGIPVMRFAGSEIYGDSARCVEEALNMLMEIP